MAFDKLFRFATSSVFASETAGRMCAEMCGTACRVDPSTSLKKFMPHITSRISEVLEGKIAFKNVTMSIYGKTRPLLGEYILCYEKLLIVKNSFSNYMYSSEVKGF